MDDGAKELLDELTEAMTKMPNDPQGVAGWLLSHYQFRKIGDGTPTERFHRAGGGGPSAEGMQLRHADNPVDEFLRRTDSFNKSKDTQAKIAKLKGGKLAQIAQDIKQGGPDPYGFDDPDPPEEDDEPSVDDIKAMRAMMRAGKNPFAGSEVSGGVKDHKNVLSAEEIVAIQQYNDEQQSPQAASGDDDLLPQEIALSSTKEGRDVVMKNRIKRIKAQESILDEGGAGPQGFWRSG
jgi:hypothetical protein